MKKAPYFITIITRGEGPRRRRRRRRRRTSPPQMPLLSVLFPRPYHCLFHKESKMLILFVGEMGGERSGNVVKMALF